MALEPGEKLSPVMRAHFEERCKTNEFMDPDEIEKFGYENCREMSRRRRIEMDPFWKESGLEFPANWALFGMAHADLRLEDAKQMGLADIFNLVKMVWKSQSSPIVSDPPRDGVFRRRTDRECCALFDVAVSVGELVDAMRQVEADESGIASSIDPVLQRQIDVRVTVREASPLCPQSERELIETLKAVRIAGDACKKITSEYFCYVKPSDEAIARLNAVRDKLLDLSNVATHPSSRTESGNGKVGRPPLVETERKWRVLFLAGRKYQGKNWQNLGVGNNKLSGFQEWVKTKSGREFFKDAPKEKQEWLAIASVKELKAELAKCRRRR